MKKKNSRNKGGVYFQWKQKEIPKQRERDKNYEKQMNYYAMQRNKIITEKTQSNKGKKERCKKINKKERKYQSNYNNDDETTLGIRYGDRTLKITSANMDDARNNETVNELDIRMEHANVDILCIQETHDAQSDDRLTRNYRYIFNAAQTSRKNESRNINEKGIGGVAILIKQEWSNNIQSIDRYSNRCIKITIETGIGNKKRHILNTYAPHMGYSRAERDEYWQQVKKIIQEIPKK